MNLENLTVAQAAAEIRSGRLSPVEYVQALFERMDRIEPQIQAWVTVDRDAVMKEAARLESLAQQKQYSGPLHGVPIGIKDIFHTAGLRTTAGSKFFQDYVPVDDARSVALLKNAGAIVLGKTVTTEFASFDPGPTRNPWNPAHTPGGSSSGSAAAVAARMCPAATGSQTVASLGRPAAFCGLVGIMPTQARVSRAGVFPVSWTLDHIGVLTRSVEDAELVLSAMAEIPITPCAAPKQIRVGVIRDFFYSKLNSEAEHPHHGVIRKLTAANVELIEVRLPAIFDIAAPALTTIMRAEMAAAHEDLHRKHPDYYGKKLRGLIETGLLLDSKWYLRALRLRRSYQRAMLGLFRDVDVLLTPGATGTAPAGLGSTGDPVMHLPLTLADFPTLSLPHAVAMNGLPLGIQLSAPPMQEGLLLSIGKVLEKAIDFWEVPKDPTG